MLFPPRRLQGRRRLRRGGRVAAHRRPGHRPRRPDHGPCPALARRGADPSRGDPRPRTTRSTSRLCPTTSQLARLVIVVDEFATLAEELPSFVPGLIAIAQRGRSLGVHLVLATQRPSGVVSPEIRANCTLRICLRTTDEADSRDVLGTTDAAHLPVDLPGRAYLRTGSGDPDAAPGRPRGRPAAPATETGPEARLRVWPALRASPRRPWRPTARPTSPGSAAPSSRTRRPGQARTPPAMASSAARRDPGTGLAELVDGEQPATGRAGSADRSDRPPGHPVP